MALLAVFVSIFFMPSFVKFVKTSFLIIKKMEIICVRFF